ncbi:MAG: endonuclease III [Oscillospiraceae bacterium]|nr:endonuclease III [Oscillospiraceae bacterium]
MKDSKIIEIIAKLGQLYPGKQRCMLNYSAPHELLIAVRLSAQCTDKRVNLVTPDLFKAFPCIQDFADAKTADVERIVKPCGLFKIKAADIVAICVELLENYNGVIPDEMDLLLKLPGVGRKTANLILGELYGKPAIVADTHVIRLSGRLGMVSTKNALKVEAKLWEIIPPEDGLNFCHRLVLHGRNVCKAGNPNCDSCGLKDLCEYPQRVK